MLGTGDELTFVAADLMSDAGWAEAVSGCDYVLHVASPFPVGAPKHEDDLVRPTTLFPVDLLRSGTASKHITGVERKRLLIGIHARKAAAPRPTVSIPETRPS